MAKKVPVMPQPLEIPNVIVRATPAGVVTVQTVGSLDAEFSPEQVEELAEWLDDVILATEVAAVADGEDEEAG